LIVLLLSHLSFSQVELITRLLSSNPGQPDTVDECSNSTLNACTNKDCIDGTIPSYGYTCKKSNNESLLVDYFSNRAFIEINTFIKNLNQTGLSLISILDIVIEDSATTSLTYIYELERALTGIEKLLIKAAGVPQQISTSLEPIFGFLLSPSRIVISTADSPVAQISFQLIFPSSSAIVSWDSLTEGNLVTLRNLSLIAMGLDPNTGAAQVRLVNEYIGETAVVVNKWLEDISLNPGEDQSYLSLACEYYGKLQSGALDIRSSGFTFSLSTLITSDQTCKYIPIPPPPEPAKEPAPSDSMTLIFSVSGLFLIMFCHLIFHK